MGVSFSVIWSSAFTSARILVTSAPPLMVLSIRFFIAGILGIALARMMGQKIELEREGWFGVVIIGIFQNALYLGLNFIGMQWIEAGLAAIIASTLPLIVAVFCWVFMKEKTNLLGILGLVSGFGGVILIMSQRETGESALLAMGLCVIGAIALAGATLWVSRMVSGNKNVMMLVGLQMFVGSFALFPFALYFETWTIEWSIRFIMAFFYTVLAPGLLATLIWFFLVGRIGPVRAAAFHFLNPFFGILVAASILAEPMTLQDGIGVVIIMVGILAVQMNRKPLEKVKS